MRLFLVGLIVFCCHEALSLQNTDSLLIQLNHRIEMRDVYLQEKLERIDGLKQQVAKSPSRENRYTLHVKIYDEYKSLNYDSAFLYARKIQSLAYADKNTEEIADSRMKLSFVLVSSGLFNEALDTLRKLTSANLSQKLKADYFYLMGRTSYDLSDFNRDEYFSAIYNLRGNAYLDSAISLMSKESSQYHMMSGLKYLHVRNIQAAQESFEQMIANFSLTDVDFAIAASTLSFIYFYNDQPEKSKAMLIRAAIADITSCTKETLAMLNLAEMLFKQGDSENAYRYVKIALEDANYYGARHRKIQVAAVFPIIEGQQLNMVESRRKMLLLYSSLITVLTILIIAFAVIILKQFKKLKEAKQVISTANDVLIETNHQLSDANKIKEEYIWYYFNTTADYIGKLDALKRSLDLKLKTKKLEDMKFVVDSINIKHERDELYHNFDLVFLKLFPDFVNVFNSLLEADDKIHLKDGQLLNTELRIFALIRMGITDNEKIAKILDYSVTTIYRYKTRIRSKSTVPNEQFDREIMAIRAI